MIDGTYLQVVLDDYHCCSKDECSNCTANATINGTDKTFCYFLAEHDEWIKNKIFKALESTD